MFLYEETTLMKFKTTLKRIFAATMAFTMVYSLTGCGAQLQMYVNDTFKDTFTEKVSQNQRIADELHAAGYINDTAYNTIISQLTAQQSQYNKASGSSSTDGESYALSEDMIVSLSQSAIRYRRGTTDPNEADDSQAITKLDYYIDDKGKTQTGIVSADVLSGYIASNYLHSTDAFGFHDSVIGTYNGWAERDASKVRPIDLIGVGNSSSLSLESGKDIIKDFVKSNSYFNLDCKIYVLKPNLGDVNGTSTNANLGVNNSIDKICAAIQQAMVNSTDSTKEYQCINTYFDVAKKDDGTPVTLGDLGFDMLSLVDVSKPLDSGELESDSIYTPGKDLVLKQCGKNMIELSFVEFNQEAVDQFKNIVGATQAKFYVHNNGTTSDLVLMEYPVYAVSEIKPDLDKTKATINFDRETGLGINLYTGNIIKYNKESGGYSKDGVEYTTIDSYLTVKENSSFAILGSTDMTLSNYDVFDKDKINSEYLTLNSETHTVQNKMYASGLDSLINSKLDISSLSDPSLSSATSLNKENKTSTLGTFKVTEGSISSGSSKSLSELIDDSNISSSESSADTGIGSSSIGSSLASLGSLISGVSSPTSSSVNSSGTVTVKAAKIVLVDYLESTYAKGLVDDEPVVNFGRKIRFLIDPKYVKEGMNQSLKVKRSDDLAYYVDKDGNRYANTDTYYLNATDFCQANLLLGGDPKVAYLSETGLPSTIDAVDSASNDINDLAKGEIGTTGSVDPVLEFPSDDIGKVDVNNTNANQLFYCVTTKQGLFGQYSIYTTWLISKSPTASIEWWNKYLSDNGFAYQVGTSAVSEYLNNNFSFELQKEGVVILDPNTIRFIQDEMQSEHNAKTYATAKTWFIILGVLLIIYAILLVLAWAIDTNADIGIDLLNKLTLGSMIAAKHTEEIPKSSKIKNKFVDGRGIIKIFFIVVVVAVILLTVNIPGLIVVIIKMFGGIAKIVENIVYGLN